MSEVISTTFQADSDDFNAEVKKAQAVIDGLTGKSLPLMEKNMNAAFQAAQKTAQGMQHLQKSSMLSGQGMLQIAQFADDAQYGLKGIMNNIPGVVQGLGMSAGVAGAISLVSLAAAKGIPLLVDLFIAADPKPVVEGIKEYGKVLAENLKQIEKTNAALTLQKQIAAQEKTFTEQVQNQAKVSPQIIAKESELAELQKSNALAAQIEAAAAAARIALARANGEDVAAVEKQTAAASAAAAQARIENERRIQQEIAAMYADEAALLQAAQEANAQTFGQSTAEIEKRISDLQMKLAESEASLKRAETEATMVDRDTTFGDEMKNQLMGVTPAQRAQKERENQILEDNLKKAKESVESLRQEMEILKAKEASQKSMGEMSDAEIQKAREAASQAATDAAAKAKALEDQKKTAAEIAALAEQERAAAEKTAAAEKAKTEATKAAAEAKRTAAEAERKAAEAKSQKDSLKDIQAEVLAMRAQAAGQKDQAAAIRANIKIAQEARQIAAATGMSEKQALEIAKEKARLQSQIDGQKTKAREEGRIRLFKAGESPSTLQRGAAGTMLRSEAFTRRTQAWMDTPMRTKSATDQVAADQLKTQQRLLQIWEKNLGLI